MEGAYLEVQGTKELSFPSPMWVWPVPELCCARSLRGASPTPRESPFTCQLRASGHGSRVLEGDVLPSAASCRDRKQGQGSDPEVSLHLKESREGLGQPAVAVASGQS